MIWMFKVQNYGNGTLNTEPLYRTTAGEPSGASYIIPPGSVLVDAKEILKQNWNFHLCMFGYLVGREG